MRQTRKKNDDLGMIKAREDWPQWPLLPLKRWNKESSLEVAVLYARPIQISPVVPGRTLLRLFEGQNIWSFDPKSHGEDVTPDEVVRRGWIVD